MKDNITLTTVEEIKAFSDSYRYKILMCFYKMKQPATVKEIAVALNEVPANVHYHVKKLEKVGILELIHTKEINGIIAKYYEPTAKDFHINCANETSEPAKKLILSESKQIIAQLYDDSKNTFLEHMDHLIDSNNKTNRTVSMENLYLTDQDAKKLAQYIKKFMDDHSYNNEDNKDIKKFHCFFSICETKN
jgi:DNA-binding transcriptional ArsR family regulator